MPLTDAEAVAALQSAITFPTVVAPEVGEFDPEPFEGLLDDVAQRFPGLQAAGEVVPLAGHALLIRWPGRGGVRPVVLVAHLDVASADTEESWTHPPFAGVVEDGVLWGRGSLDSKGSAVAICTAVERHIDAGFVPESDVWIYLGFDRHVDGAAVSGAVDVLLDRAVEPWFVLDEGGTIAADAFPGVSVPLAVIGVGEKGLVDLELRTTARSRETHPSMPPRIGPGERLAQALARIADHPFPPHLPDPVVEMLTTVSPHASGPIRLATRFAPLLRTPLAHLFARLGPETAALVRSTTTVTRLAADAPSTELVPDASATVTARILTGETVASTLDRIRKVIADPEVEISAVAGGDPSPVSSTDDDAYRLIAATSSELGDDVLPVPYVMLAPTDARHFHRVWPRVYRFTPLRTRQSQRRTLRDVDERLDVSAYLDAVRWYERLLEHV